MAWNEPGGNGNKDRDPWGGGNRGNGGKNEGPPDLDEVIKNVQDKVTQLFGGGNGGKRGGSNNDTPINPVPIIALLLVALGIVGLFSSAYQVQQAEKAVVLRTGKFHSIEEAGLKFKFPIIDEVYKVNVQAVRSMPLDAAMLTADSNIVDISLVVQYQVTDPKSYLLEVAQAEDGLHHATESALRHVVGGMNMDDVITGQRQLVASEVKTLLQDSLNGFNTGILVSEVSMQDANPPQQVKAAFDDVNKAKEDEERLKNEAEAYSNGIIPVARGMAKRQFEEAEGYKQSVIARAEGEADRFTKLLKEYRRAPEVTRKRLYIETMESVYSSTSKIMVDTEGGNNLLYLPLDKIVNQNSTPVINRQTASEAAREVMGEAQTQINKRVSGSNRLNTYRERRKEER